ncbi:hypothetical protein D3879_19960 [Pseudomonas cavernicola]|uniref:Uncharacterized protein n=1 Tax=Pseudomonas cavernicola TaxID=2320866 RepID=A0A418XCS5_9PSED|nr:hypothetical protein [Pseudomonas cavernicola]RJG10301.1 hypothetical protein D3879_19960 [Pseudomonas cavernicola]
MSKLSAVKVSHLLKSGVKGLANDGHGLYFKVTAGSKGSWISVASAGIPADGRRRRAVQLQ